ncbi:hypothetical protein CU669_15385 [Paramagnetospirillum kuznetsovii]|uniref:EF-hand domain-containing protein n=1 Tax=Paramagnetospirillum kuznetsovii TaxID=2053833 RepID=A0A364NV91_9PROT|nr:hypothetical protein [Paramagnetospirillum kuznetsovii]RAU20973.1 hypothetical protein CU669_15385 [Paramagnetospirillum kuznetsovii]
MTTEHGEAGHEAHWKFFRAGGFDQVRLDTGHAVASLGKLDQKLWAALSCPTRGIEIDARTLDIIDSDKDGRVRAGEVIAAVDWACNLLKTPDILLRREDSLPLDAIDDGKDEGKAVLAAARRILAKSGKAGAEAITMADVAGVEEVFAANDFNGDGIVPPDIVDDPAVRSVIEDIIACLGGELDRSGLDGVSKDKVEAFFADAEVFNAWAAKAEADAALTPLGEATEDAATALSAVVAKVEDWFTRSALAAFDPRAVGPLNRSEEDWVAVSHRLLSSAEEGLISFPLAEVVAGGSLPLGLGCNPAWAAAMELFRLKVVVPLLGERQALSAEDWAAIKERFAAWTAWRAEMPQGPVAALGKARIAEVTESGAQAAILDLIEKDLALEAEAKAIASVDRLLRFCRDLVTLLNNFVAFRDFYTRKHKAVFQAGTLFLDGRSCELCVRVEDPAKHAPIATLSRIYLVYCECTRRGGDAAEKMFIAAAVTDGDSDQLMVGRNGVFYDRKGGDWDANVVRIIDHPISIRQSFWAPYKKVSKLVAQQAEKFAAAKAAETPAPVAVLIPTHAAAPAPAAVVPAKPPVAAAAHPPAPVPPPPFDAGRFAGIFAALGLAVGAIGTAVASMVTGFLSLPWWQIPLALLGVLLAISGPSMLIASFKLHQRNLGPILDANGWAVNTHARINIPFGTALTHLAKLPEGAVRSLKDPYAEKQPPWGKLITMAVLVGAVALLWKFGVIAKLWGMLHH